VLKEIGARLQFLVDVGLDYLSIARGGCQPFWWRGSRIRLATQMVPAYGCAYILDERVSVCTSAIISPDQDTGAFADLGNTC